MDYVLVRVAPLQPGLPRPRFSLYLSAQLQYGVIIIYHRQCAILLEDIQHTIDRLLRSMKQLKIDLVAPDRPILIPDCLSAMEEAEWAQDPFFGVMGLSSPSTFIQFEGVELPEVTARHIEMLMEQEDQFPAEDEEREQEREAERIREEHRITVLTEQLGVTTVASEDMVLLPEEERGLPVEVPVPTPLETTPVPAIPLPSPPPRLREQEPEEETVRRREREEEQERERQREKEREPSALEHPELGPDPGVRRRPRQLLFIDVQTQIPQEELRRAIQDPLTETHPLVLIEAPSRRTVPPAELLSNPCTFLPPDILALWEQGAVITPLERAPASMREAEEEMEGEPERETEAEAKEEEVKEKEEREEVHRELVETGLPRPEVSVSSDVLGEPSDRELSRLITPETRESPTGETFFPLEDIPEERPRTPEREFEQMAVTGESLLEMVLEPLEEQGMVSFHSLLPPMVDRITVACYFYKLLEVVSARQLCVQQDEPYGNIIISPGSQYEQEGDWMLHTH
ncbi:hypothetical protein AGOR_G00208480 [Albula goreensis]|uniref:Meiotic recombination protein REC8 homolog n=1 Tax=Albula goreensis TaxID=1534307 RepID=A0A8T3CNA6_9TELE|nr:hypothetical protein AGOR_G00208480 [Albula goreensis]